VWCGVLETIKYFNTCGVISVLCVVKLCLMDVKCIILIHLVLYYYLKLLEVQLNEHGRIDTWQYLQKYGKKHHSWQKIIHPIATQIF
jgi:hypothetical protein